jgi:GntR family transcriptional regulator
LDSVFFIRQTIFADGEPLMFEEIYVPQAVIPQLDIVNSSVFSMVDIFTFYSVHVAEVRQNLEIIKPSVKLRQKLNIPEKTAVMLIETIRSEACGQVVAYNNVYARSDKVSFKVQLHNIER